MRRQAPEEESGQSGADGGDGSYSRGRKGDVLVVAQIAEKGRGDNAGDVEEGKQKGGRCLRQQSDFVSVSVEVCLRNAISRALKDDGEAVDIKRLMPEKMPRDLPSPMTVRGYARRLSRYQKDCRNASSGRNSRPYPQRYTESVAIQKKSQQKRTSRSHNVLARQNNAVRHSPIAGIEPFTKRQRGRTVDESTSQRSHDSLRRHQMPNVSAERRQQEADACERRAA